MQLDGCLPFILVVVDTTKSSTKSHSEMPLHIRDFSLIVMDLPAGIRLRSEGAPGHRAACQLKGL
jgi:hypothetical protein